MEDSAIESVSSKSCGGGVDVAVLRALLAAAAAARFALGDACCGRDSSGASGEPQPRCPSAKVMPLLAFGDADGRTSSSSSSSSTAEDCAAAGAVVTVCWSSRCDCAYQAARRIISFGARRSRLKSSRRARRHLVGEISQARMIFAAVRGIAKYPAPAAALCVPHTTPLPNQIRPSYLIAKNRMSE